MTPTWTCATCEFTNSETNRFCGHCGEVRADQASARRPTGPDRRCHGPTPAGPGQGRCTFRAEVWESGFDGYCGWHHRVKFDPQANTFEEFERWLTTLTHAKICDRWTHYTPVTLWDGMRGVRESITPHWCGGTDCTHKPEVPCTKSYREHLDELAAIIARPDTVFTRPSQRATTPADPDPVREARRQELLAQAREILKAGEI